MPNIKCQKENSPKKLEKKKYIKFYGTRSEIEISSPSYYKYLQLNHMATTDWAQFVR